jgi:hypothetical protein
MKNKILIVITFLAGTLMFNSCLKDKLNSDWTSSLSGKMYAEFVNYGLTSFTINNLPAAQQVKIFVNIATDAVPTSDITLTVAVDAAALAAYNTANGTSLVLCPGITPTPITIKKGTRNTYYYISLSGADKLSLTTAYAIPLTITAATGGVMIAANKQTTIIQVPVANIYEGSYNLSYYVLRNVPPIDAALSGNYRNMPWKLSTSGANSVTFWKTQLWGDGKTGISGIGPWMLTINTTTNALTVTDATNALVTVNPAYNNRYDPAKKTFYFQVSWGAGLNSRAATDTLVYSGKY